MESSYNDRRRQTRSSVYHCLYETEGFCTRQMLAQNLGLSLPTIYQNLTELVDSGFVRYSGEAHSTGGRRAAGLEIIPDARIAVGVSVAADRLRFSAADLRLSELASRSVDFTTRGRTIAELSRVISEELERFLDEARLDRSRLLGVCVALPGLLTPQRDRLLFAPTLRLRDSELRPIYESLRYPSYVENDATSSGHAEWFTRGAVGNMAYVSLECGVGGSVLIGGSPYHGSNQRSCEFGHMCIVPGGLKCSCGKHGCLEAYCSPDRVSKDLGISLTAFFDELERHNPEFAMLWSDVLQHLAVGIANIRMCFDCDVVLGGLLTQHMPAYLGLLRQYVAANDPFSDNALYVSLSVLGGRSVPLGAALHFISEFLDNM